MSFDKCEPTLPWEPSPASQEWATLEVLAPVVRLQVISTISSMFQTWPTKLKYSPGPKCRGSHHSFYEPHAANMLVAAGIQVTGTHFNTDILQSVKTFRDEFYFDLENIEPHQVRYCGVANCTSLPRHPSSSGCLKVPKPYFHQIADEVFGLNDSLALIWFPIAPIHSAHINCQSALTRGILFGGHALQYARRLDDKSTLPRLVATCVHHRNNVSSSPNKLINRIMMPTFDLGKREECLAFFADAGRAATPWVMKMPLVNQGKGVTPVTHFEKDLIQPWGKCKEKPPGRTRWFHQVPVVQQLIDPHLICGRKYDLRTFLLLRAQTHAAPAEAYHLSGSLYMRRCSADYADRDNTFLNVHRRATICNNHESLRALKELLVGSNKSEAEADATEAEERLLEIPSLPRAAAGLLVHLPDLHKRLDHKLSVVASAWAHEMLTSPRPQVHPLAPSANNWHLISVDFLVDREHVPWLTEVNSYNYGTLTNEFKIEGAASELAAGVRIAQSRFLQDVQASGGSSPGPDLLDPCLTDCSATRLELHSCAALVT